MRRLSTESRETQLPLRQFCSRSTNRPVVWASTGVSAEAMPLIYEVSIHLKFLLGPKSMRSEALPLYLLSFKDRSGRWWSPIYKAASPQVHGVSYKPTSRLPSLFVRPAVTFPVSERLSGTNLYCWLTAERPRLEPATSRLLVQLISYIYCYHYATHAHMRRVEIFETLVASMVASHTFRSWPRF